jgi:hypothetical protein
MLLPALFTSCLDHHNDILRRARAALGRLGSMIPEGKKLFPGPCAPSNNYSRSPHTGVVGLVALSVGPQSRVAIQRPGEPNSPRGVGWSYPFVSPSPASCAVPVALILLPTNTNTGLVAVIKVAAKLVRPYPLTHYVPVWWAGGVNSLLSHVFLSPRPGQIYVCLPPPNRCTSRLWEIRHFLFPQDDASSSKQETV